ncbi:hypothetical protein [Sphingobium terrigena]|uniref:hypothetical protein n=1 Tax=Sphingobium terrigena TaxID=2304063 RepID=UPI001603FD08|nr:hypothetical protein [Sphingobium terrigena]
MTLLTFQPLDLTFQHVTDEGGAALPSHKLIDPVAKTFGQSDIGRFHIERRSSHPFVVTVHRALSIASRLSGAGY